MTLVFSGQGLAYYLLLAWLPSIYQDDGLSGHTAGILFHVAGHGLWRDRPDPALRQLERRLGLRQGLQRQVAIACDRVVEHRVAMAERAALDVLAGEADGDPVGEDRGQGQFLGGRPVDRPVVGGL